MSDLRCEAWQAVYDREPGKPAALKVTGVCHAPQPGWSVTLHRSDQQDGERELRLTMDVERPQVAPDRRTDVAVEFVTFTDDPVDKVSIEGVAQDIPVDVLPGAPG
jgi:hypothetical protein